MCDKESAAVKKESAAARTDEAAESKARVGVGLTTYNYNGLAVAEVFKNGAPAQKYMQMYMNEQFKRMKIKIAAWAWLPAVVVGGADEHACDTDITDYADANMIMRDPINNCAFTHLNSHQNSVGEMSNGFQRDWFGRSDQFFYFSFSPLTLHYLQ